MPISSIDLAALWFSISYGMALQRMSDSCISGGAASWGITALSKQIVRETRAKPAASSRRSRAER